MSKVWGKMWLGKRLRRSEGKDLSPPPPCILNLGERGCEVGNGLCHGLTDGNGWMARKWESLRGGWACPCGGLWVSASVSVCAANFGQV